MIVLVSLLVVFGACIIGIAGYAIYRHVSKNRQSRGGKIPRGAKTPGAKTPGAKTTGGKTTGGKTDRGKTTGGKTRGAKTPGAKNSSDKDCIPLGDGVGPGLACCDGLALTWMDHCAVPFDCNEDAYDMLQKNPCFKHKTGSACIADQECVAMGIGPEMGGYVCVGKEYKNGLGIGPDTNQDCFMRLARRFAFEGAQNGCTASGNRPVNTPDAPVADCCTLDTAGNCQ